MRAHVHIQTQKHVDFDEFFSAIRDLNIEGAELAEDAFNDAYCPANGSSVGISYWSYDAIDNAEGGKKAILLFLRDVLELRPREWLYIDVYW